MPFTLRDIPSAMRAHKMPLGATLMERWFALPPWAMPDAVKTGQVAADRIGAGRINTRDITMAWALQCPRAAAAYARLLLAWRQGERFRLSQALLAKRVAAWRQINALRGEQPFRFGDLTQAVPRIDGACQIALERVVSGYFDPVDDFYAALGTAAFKLAVTGMVTPQGKGRASIAIDEIGIYLRDSYDFNGDQPLGSWGRQGFSRVAVLAADIPVVSEGANNDGWLDRNRYWRVGNDSFRAWRQHYHKGGDFLVFSDVKRHRLPGPLVVEVRL